MTTSFHEVRFPTGISRGASGGPERRTEIVTLSSGHEERNTRWAHSRRRYNAGYGIRSLDDLDAVVAFFEERRGRLYGFRWKDHGDYKSCAPSAVPGPLDQVLGTGDGVRTVFDLAKTYGGGASNYIRPVKKPVAGTIRVAVDGMEKSEGADFSADTTNGQISFLASAIPAAGAVVTAGFEFDVPVRFDTDFLQISLDAFNAGQIPDINIIEVRL